MTAGGVVASIGRAVFIIEGPLKFWNTDMKVLRMSLPCGGGLILLGVGVLMLGLET